MSSGDAFSFSVDDIDHTNIVDSNGTPVTAKYVKNENILPLLTHSYNLHNLREEDKLIPPLSFDKFLDAPISTVSTLNVQPGDPGFLLWFSVSTLLPLLSSCLAPLANMISIIGLADSWRIDVITQKHASDPGPIRALNSLSLAFGLVGNVSLLVNFSTTKRYATAQSVSIICWTLASIILAVGIILLNRFHMSDQFVRSEGHWLSVFTSGLYAICTCTMSLNVLGFVLGKYPPVLNLNSNERALMRYTVALAVWLVIGACVCGKVLPSMDYGSALYFCVVSILTIGLGDILPDDSGAKAFILVFSLVGVIMMGLIVAMIRQVSHNTSAPVILWHRMESERRKCLQIIEKNNIRVSAPDSFKIMRRIDHKSAIEQQSMGLLLTMITFCVFWLIGALVFHYIENWSYFNGVYFCLLCLITIGYGDFSPKTSLGRVFFISWAISAVPLMTILISNVGDALFGSQGLMDILKSLNSAFKAMFLLRKIQNHEADLTSIDSINRELGVNVLGQNNEPNIDSAFEDVNEQSSTASVDSYVQLTNRIERKITAQKNDLINILAFVNQLKPILEDTIDSPSIEYDHEQWHTLMKALQSDTRGHHLKGTYWVSEESPLRLPLQEPNYFISRIFFKIETDLMRLIKESNEELETIYKSKESE